MSFIHKYIADQIKLYTLLIKRFYKDIVSNYSFAKHNTQKLIEYPFKISINQSIEVFPPLTHKNQIHNIKIAAHQIEKYTIFPNQILSFWKSVGKPTHRKGYVVENKEICNSGENLSQLTGIMYYLSLLSGLQVIERYNYLTDIFSEEQRIYPLGTDAPVSYGTQDLRVKNNYNFPVTFHFIITDSYIQGILLSEKEIMPNKITFKRTDYKKYKEIITRINRRTVAFSKYSNPQK